MTQDKLKTKMATVSIRPFSALGKADHGWLKANHHFSFAGYYDPAHMGWGNIRVWNDDEIAPQSGFPPHFHDNMEIITYVRDGAITHRDNMGNVGRTEAGDVQVMSAGTGVQHSEYNLEDTICRLFQIWIIPRERGVAPRWDQCKFSQSGQRDRIRILASGYNDPGALHINADARFMGAAMITGEQIEYDVAAKHNAYLLVSKGKLRIGDNELNARDGAAIGEGYLKISALTYAEWVMVESA